jgi:RNA polymerase-binding transcription factor DksA
VQLAALREARIELVGQADRLEDEAHQLIEEQEMGDVQFDDEGGEGDTMVVERERDLALSAQARQMVADIDAALERLKVGTYGYSVESGRPIPRERLEAIPWATVLVEEKVGGIGRR